MNYSVLSSAPAPRQEWVLRIFCILCGLSLATDGVVLFIIKSTESTLQFLLQSYYILFGFLIVLIEFELKIIKKYWRFLIGVFGKGMFYLFAGSMCIYGDFFFTYLIGALLIVASIFIMCCKPRYGVPQACDPPEVKGKRIDI